MKLHVLRLAAFIKGPPDAEILGRNIVTPFLGSNGRQGAAATVGMAGEMKTSFVGRCERESLFMDLAPGRYVVCCSDEIGFASSRFVPCKGAWGRSSVFVC